MLSLLAMADLRGVNDLVDNVLVVNEEQVESREVPMVAAIAAFMIPVLRVQFFVINKIIFFSPMTWRAWLLTYLSTTYVSSHRDGHLPPWLPRF